MKIYRKHHKGLTLVEVIVSLAIIGIIAVSLLPMFTSGFANMMSTGRRTNAMNHDAQKYMDQIYSGASPTDIHDPTNGVYAIELENDYEGTGMRLIEITVEYPLDKSVTLKGLVP